MTNNKNLASKLTSILGFIRTSVNQEKQYLYHLENASLTLYLVNYLANCSYISSSIVTVINQRDGWIVNIQIKSAIEPQQEKNIQAVFNELGVVYTPSKLINSVLMKLESGATITEVMRQYHVSLVSHGVPKCDDIEVFRTDVIKGLGYCPQYLA
ncbi:hypothetical protein [Nostoc sp. FACHB-110]|uniref:hypothetical protein n=1 Tax=Nostoc sp. FACHB-110 TaxID=2692834 RepID=UPI001687C927|nr:hypothetical protein [Nostoc sp. FACHB-110]MBD2439597.1 hypothetical protein [Nostoc sp. FACHB-110]